MGKLVVRVERLPGVLEIAWYLLMQEVIGDQLEQLVVGMEDDHL